MGSSWDKFGTSLEQVWEMFGKCLGNVWNILCLIINILIYIFGKCLGNVWEMFGKCLGNSGEENGGWIENLFPDVRKMVLTKFLN